MLRRIQSGLGHQLRRFVWSNMRYEQVQVLVRMAVQERHGQKQSRFLSFISDVWTSSHLEAVRFLMAADEERIGTSNSIPKESTTYAKH